MAADGRDLSPAGPGGLGPHVNIRETASRLCTGGRWGSMVLRARALWTAASVVLFALGLSGLLFDSVWVSTLALFWIVTVAASLCVVGAVWVMLVAHRSQSAELGVLGTATYVVSILPLVHGLTAPDVLYGPNDAVMVSVFLALPAAALAGSPLLAWRWPVGVAVLRAWRHWAGAWVILSTGVAAVLLIRPSGWPLPEPGSPGTIAVVAPWVAALMALSWRQLRLFHISGRVASLVASLGLVSIAASAMVWMGGPAFGVGWWLAHALDILGVLAVAVTLARSHDPGRSTAEILAPVVARDPIAALEVGLAPVVHRFVADLERKDQITRDHVVRVAELAMTAGQIMGLAPAQLRRLGLGALLHDIGKLEIPSEVLDKPGRLTDAEMDVMRTHTTIGASMVEAVPSLAEIAPLVGSHHERWDGRGYPRGLSGASLSVEATVISVCDAFDAMANTRQYRAGMGSDRAVAVLREHAGSQWSPTAVEAVIRAAARLNFATPRLDGVGRADARTLSGSVACGCGDALPVEVLAAMVPTPELSGTAH